MKFESLARIQRSYERLTSAAAAEMTLVFYRRLFSEHPSVRPLFQNEMDVQRGHLAAALALVVRNIHRLDLIERTAAKESPARPRPEHVLSSA